MTGLVSLPTCSKCAPLRAAATRTQKFDSDTSAVGLSLGCNIFAAAAVGTCFHMARSRLGIASKGVRVRATATKSGFEEKTKEDASGKVINGKTNGPAVALAETITNRHKTITFKVPSSLLALLPPEMHSADSLERDRYLCTALEIGLKALANAADTKLPSEIGFKGLVKLEQRLDKHMSEIKHELHVEKKLQSLRQETVDAKEAGTAKGVRFEQAGYEELVVIASKFGDRVEHTGSACVSGTRRKIGDHVIHINQPGVGDLRLVVEQKVGSSYTKNKLLGQMTKAMEVREAQAAIGLIQRKKGKTQAAFEQHSPKQIIAAVDYSEDSEETDLDWFALEVAYRTLRSQVVAAAIQSHAVGVVDVAEVKTRIKNVETELNCVCKVKLNAATARIGLEAIVSTVTELAENVRKELTAMENALAEAASGEREAKFKK